MAAFVQTAKDKNVDFIIELGDFCRLDSASLVYRNLWNSFPGGKHHVIGNHDMDRYTYQEYTQGMNMPGRYYSFDQGNFHFIVLDGNNLFDGKKYTHYAKANYYVDAKKRAHIDPEQMEWLKNDLAATDKRCILFSHQSIEQALNNGTEVRKILEAENKRAGCKKVVMAFGGHNHSNYSKEINGITYVQINSASYVWIGEPTQTEKRYPKEVNDRFGGILKYSMTYNQAPLCHRHAQFQRSHAQGKEGQIRASHAQGAAHERLGGHVSPGIAHSGCQRKILSSVSALGQCQ